MECNMICIIQRGWIFILADAAVDGSLTVCLLKYCGVTYKRYVRADFATGNPRLLPGYSKPQ